MMREAAPRDARRERLVAILLMCGAVLCFAALDTTAKWLNRELPTLQTVWGRYAFNVLFVVMIVNPWTTPGVGRTRKPVLQGLRSLLLLASTICNFAAIRHLQLAETMSINFAMPLIVALLAGPLLGEWVGPRRLVAILIGFTGVLLVARPGYGQAQPAILYAFAGTICYALYAITTRMLAAHDSTATTLLLSGLAGVAALTPLQPIIWTPPPSTLAWILFVTTGGWGALGHWLLILAHARAPAAVLAPFVYTQIAWIVALGYLVFGDVPDRLTILGSGIVIASGLYLLHRERARGGTGA